MLQMCSILLLAVLHAVLGCTEAVHGAAHSDDGRTRGKAHSIQGDGGARRRGTEQDPGRCRRSLHGPAAVSPCHQEVHSVRQQGQGSLIELKFHIQLAIKWVHFGDVLPASFLY